MFIILVQSIFHWLKVGYRPTCSRIGIFDQGNDMLVYGLIYLANTKINIINK